MDEKIRVKKHPAEERSRHKKRRRGGGKALNITALIVAVLTHAAIIALIFLSYKYFSLDLKTALGIVGIAVCLLAIIDILFLVGFRYREKGLKIIALVMALLMMFTGIFGTYYIANINSSINNIIDNSGTDQYETIGGVFTCYVKDGTSKQYEDLDDLKSVSNLKVGILYDDGVGTGTMAVKLLEDNDISAKTISFNTTDDLLSALVGEDEDENVDVAVFPASYRQRLSTDENVDYGKYLDNMVDFYSFEEKVKTGENEAANMDLSSEPFNILLIGFAPEDEAMTYGLADSIIVASVNPQTFTVSMTSIARDSFVPITCFGGTRDKINAARGTSRQCLMDTVGELLGLDINYYMEVNFLGVVQIVDAIGGIVVDNPVTFVGQSPSGTRGTYTVWVPAGESVPLNGEQALAFARERHAMPNGDFDRQQHQQEVIAQIVKGLLEMKDVNKALDVMKAAGNNISTNLSLSQLTGVFNYLVNTKNYMGVSAFNMIDIQNMRVTGYPSWTYNYSMRLPLWIYKLYNGSIQEAKDRINDVLNIYNLADLEQPNLMTFFAAFPYSRGILYSEYFNEEEEHDALPAYYPYLTKYTYEQAMAWAAANGVTLQVTFITEDSPYYSAGEDGWVVDQSPRQGALVSEYPVGSITVMGNGDPNYVPEYTVSGCNDENSCRAFANSKGINVEISYVYDDSKTEGSFAGTNFVNGDTITKNDTLIIYIYKHREKVNVPQASGNVNSYVATLQNLGFKVTTSPVTNGATAENDGSVIDVRNSGGNSVSGGTAYKGDTLTVLYYSYEEPVTPTCGANATYNSSTGQCECNSGYEGDPNSGCTMIQTTPTCGANAHPEGNACVCDAGYEGDPNTGCTLSGGGSGEGGDGGDNTGNGG